MANSLTTSLDRIAQGGDLSKLNWLPGDPQIAEELSDQVFMDLCQGYFITLCADGKHADFGPG